MTEPTRRNDFPGESASAGQSEGQDIYVRYTPPHYVLGRGSYFTEDEDTSYDPFPSLTKLKKKRQEEKSE